MGINIKTRIWWAIKTKIYNVIRWIKYRTINRFNVVKIKSLKPGYYDIDLRMLHAMFDLLVEFIEKEEPFERIDWDATPEVSNAAKEIKELYEWWVYVYPHRKSPLDDLDESLIPPILSDRAHLDEYPAYQLALKETIKLENEWDDEDTTNLCRLIMIRGFLWT
jgi:hypothetical protein